MKKAIHSLSLMDHNQLLAIFVWCAVIVSSFFPFWEARDTLEPAFVTTFSGAGLWSVSPTFGTLVFVLPFLFLALLLSQDNQSTKTILWFALVPLQVMSLPTAILAVEEWAETNSYALCDHAELGLAVYAACSIVAILWTYIAINQPASLPESSPTEDENSTANKEG